MQFTFGYDVIAIEDRTGLPPEMAIAIRSGTPALTSFRSPYGGGPGTGASHRIAVFIEQPGCYTCLTPCTTKDLDLFTVAKEYRHSGHNPSRSAADQECAAGLWLTLKSRKEEFVHPPPALIGMASCSRVSQCYYTRHKIRIRAAAAVSGSSSLSSTR